MCYRQLTFVVYLMILFGRKSDKEDDRLHELLEEDRFEEFRGSIQIFSIMLALPLFPLFWFADLIYVPHLKWHFLVLRLLVIPYSIAIFYLSKKVQTLKGMHVLAWVFTIFCALAVTYMTFLAGGVSSPYYAGINLATLATLAFLPMSKRSRWLWVLFAWSPFYIWGFISKSAFEDWRMLGIHSFFIASTIYISIIIRSFFDRLRLKEIKTRLELSDEQKKLKNEQEKLQVANRLIREIFGRYLSDDVVESILKLPEGLFLGGEKRRVTIVMSDLRDFTSISEQLKPEHVVQLLNSYFKIMFDVIEGYGGTVNEISGDSLLILFGAPQDLYDHTQRAVA